MLKFKYSDLNISAFFNIRLRYFLEFFFKNNANKKTLPNQIKKKTHLKAFPFLFIDINSGALEKEKNLNFIKIF